MHNILTVITYSHLDCCFLLTYLYPECFDLHYYYAFEIANKILQNSAYYAQELCIQIHHFLSPILS